MVKQKTPSKGNIGGNRGDVAERFFVNRLAEDTPLDSAYFDDKTICKLEGQQQRPLSR